MNKVVLYGNVGKDPEIKKLDSGVKIAKFSLATSSKDKDKNQVTQWHNIVMFDKLSDLCEKYVKKGSKLILEGEIRYREYTDKDNVKKYFTEIVCNHLEFADTKQDKPSEFIPDPAKQDEDPF